MADSVVMSLLLVNGIAFLGAVSKGLAGFGLPLIMVPLVGLWLPLPVAVPIVMLIALVGTVPMLGVVARQIRWRRDLVTGLAFVAGVLVGVQLLVTVPEVALRRVLGVVIVVFVGYLFLRPPAPAAAPALSLAERGRLGGCAAAQGVLSGALGGGAVPLVPYLAIRYPAGVARAILTATFMLGTISQVGGYAFAGLVDGQVLTLGLGAIPGMLAGLYAGTKLHNAINAQTFTRVIGVLLLLPALNFLGLW